MHASVVADDIFPGVVVCIGDVRAASTMPPYGTCLTEGFAP
jgi:hypothetical protein